MIITVLFIIASVAIAYLFFNSKFEKIKECDLWTESPLFWKSVLILVIGLTISFFQPLIVERIDAGHIGIRVSLAGDSRGVSKWEYKTGWVVYNTWASRIYEFPTYQQHIQYEEQQVITKGGFAVAIKPSFNYSLKVGAVGDMFQNLRLSVKEIEQQWLLNATIGAVNDVTNKWAPDDIFNEREQFESSIVKEVNARVSKWFTISQLRTNITPPPSLQASIEAKTKAIQDVQVAENQKRVAVADGDRRIATAKADSTVLVVNASAKSEAIRREQTNLTEQYLRYMKIQKWDGANSKVITGEKSGGVIVNLDKE